MEKTIELTDDQAETLGTLLVQLLDLREMRPPFAVARYSTTYGSKTVMGLGRTVHRLVEGVVNAKK